jgi:hypothetical protein
MMEKAGEPSIIKSDDIYECLACGKMYTEDALYKHEDECDKIEAYLAWRETQE